MAGYNENCLQGMRCPKCGNRTRLKVEVMKWVIFVDSGTDDDGGDNEWCDSSGCICCQCDYADSIQAFKDYRTDAQFAAGVPPITEEPDEYPEECECCGKEYPPNGEAWNGLCPSCADRVSKCMSLRKCGRYEAIELVQADEGAPCCALCNKTGLELDSRSNCVTCAVISAMEAL